MNYERIELGKQAKLYVQDRLSIGLGLSSNILRLHRILDGNVETYLPRTSRSARINELSCMQFKHGGITRPEDSLAILVDLACKFLGSDNDRLCIFENPNAQIPLNWSSEFTSYALSSGNDVYNLALGTSHDKADIETAILESKSGWIFIGVMTSFPDISRLARRREITNEEIELLAERAEHIIIGAFDGEGYLIWSKPQDQHCQAH